MLLGVCIALGVSVSASRADSRDRDRGTRPWLLDATIGPRRGEASGTNARLSLAWVPFDDLSPTRDDRTWYVSVGGMVAAGSLRFPTPAGGADWDTLILAPEVRTGVTFDIGELDAHLYLSGSVGWMRATSDDTAASHHVAMRLAAGFSGPGMWRDAVSFERERSAREANFDDEHRAAHDVETLGYGVMTIFGLFIPDTIEVTWERANGLEFTGVAWGYSL